MKTNSTTVFVCTAALTGALVLGSSLQGCRSDSISSAGTGGTTTTSTSSQTGTGGTSSDAGPSVPVTIQQITDPTAPGHVGAKTPVKLSGVVAMSIPFLVSKSSAGSCLWGIFVSSPGLTQTAPNTGMLVVGYGTPATVADGGTKAYCPTIQPYPPAPGMPSGSPFPDDTQPGDVFDIYGVTDSYIPTTCTAVDAAAGSSSVPSLQVGKVTTATKTGTAPVPKAYVMTTADLASLAGGSDTSWLDKFGNVRVEVDNVSVMPYTGALTDTYGHMYLQDGVQVGDKLYYVGYVKAIDACYSGPSYPTYSPTFQSITGFVYLDYCNWGLSPSNKCFDLVPASDDCASVAYADGGEPDGSSPDGGDGGTVPNAGLVCLH